MGESIRCDRGGIRSLGFLIQEHGEALENDLLRAGLRLDWLGTEDFTWRDLKVFTKYSPVDSALFRAVHPPTEEEMWDLDAQLLAGLFDLSSATNYLLKRLGGDESAKPPELLPRPGVKKRNNPDFFVGKPVSFEEMDALLGWNIQN